MFIHPLLSLLVTFASSSQGSTVARPDASRGLDALQGIWIATTPQSAVFRITILNDYVTIDSKPGSQPIHGYIALASIKDSACDLVLEHRGTIKCNFRISGSELDLALDPSLRASSSQSPTSKSALVNLHLHRYPTIYIVPEHGAVASVGQIRLPSPTGPFHIGRIRFNLVDASRDEPNILDGHQHYRELAVHLWYPVKDTVRAASAPYYPNFEAVQAAIGIEGANGMKEEMDTAFPFVRRVASGALDHAPSAIVPAGSPLLIFLSGQGYCSTHYTALIEDLVSHGYTVAGIESTYLADCILFEGNRPVKFAAERWEQERNYPETILFNSQISNLLAEDAMFALNQLRSIARTETCRNIDFTHVGIFGHSIGGRAAALACQMDDRLSACIDLDGFSSAGNAAVNFGGNSMRQPFMLFRIGMTQPSSKELEQSGMTGRNYSDWSNRASSQRLAFYRRTGSNAFEATLVALMADHGSFSDIPLINPSPKAVQVSTIKAIRGCVLQFFDRFLRKKSAPALSPSQHIFPQVSVQSFALFEKHK